MFRKLSTYVLFLLLGTPLAALAQGTGTLAGRVTDATTGETLPGVNIIIEGTQLGAATDLDGNYRIIGIPVGEYTVEASFVGFEPQVVEGVNVSSGYTTQQDFALGENVEELEEVVVEYERPIIQRDAIGAPRVVTGEEIQNLPVRGVADVAALQGGVVSNGATNDLFVRGGREQEIQYYVDGVKVIGGTPTVNPQAIQEQEMLIGTIPARYGDVQAGVISITTRSGGNDFFGSLEAITSEALDAYGYNLGSLSLGGPIMPGRVTFFVSGQGTFQSDSSPYGIETYRLSDEAYNDLIAHPQVIEVAGAEGTRFIPFPQDLVAGGGISPDSLETLLFQNGLIGEGESLTTGLLVDAPETFTADDFELGRGKDDPFQELSLNGNLNFNLTDAFSLRVGGGFNSSRAEEFTYTNSFYNRDAFNHDERDLWRVNGTFRHRLSDNAFYQLHGEFQDFQYVQYPNGFSSNVEDVLNYGDIDNPNSAIARSYYVLVGGEYQQLFTTDGGTRPGRVQPGTFGLPGRPLTNFQKQHDQQFRFTGNATTQLGVHQVEFGAEYEQETRRFYSVNPFSLARFVNDEDGAEQTLPGIPEGGITSYDQLPFEAFRAITTYYGYNYLGTEEVDDQDINGYFPNAEGQRTNTNLAPYRPIYYAGYVQDKIEFRDLVITLGVRADVFDNNTTVLKDIYAPVPIVRAGDLESRPSGIGADYAVYFADDETTVVGYRDLDGNFYDEEGIEVTATDITTAASGQVLQIEGAPLSEAFTEYDPQVTVMPRVGVSFPVTDRALFFASYNVTSQRPTEQAFAPLSFFEELNGQQSRVPNPRLEPEKTTQYELGFRQRLGERAAFTLSGFYRTQENKISNRSLFGGFPQYGTYLNADFTTTQGVEVGFDLRRTNNLAVNVNYTLAFAQGTGSDAGATANIVWRGTYFPQFISPADFDQRHTANITVDYRFGEGEGPMIGGAHLLENFGINVLGAFGSGQRYTALESADFSINDSFTSPPEGSINSATLPATSRIDLRIDRSFDLGFAGSSLKAYLWVQNLFDTQNVLAVYRATGLPDEDGFALTPEGQTQLGSPGRLFNYQAYVGGPVNNGGNQSSGAPLFYSLPRRIRLGLLFDF